MKMSRPNNSSLNIIWLSTWIALRPLLEIFCHFEVKGVENLTNLKKPLIIAIAKHGSRLDPWIVSAGIPFSYNKKFIPIRFMTYFKYMEIPVAGPFIKFAYSAYPVTPGQGLEKTLKSSIEILSNGEAIGIFPEGGLSKDNSFREAKTGAVYLAAMTNTPILPVYLGGTFGLNFFSFFSFRKRVRVCFGKPMYMTDLFKDRPLTNPIDFHESTKVLMNEIASLSKL